MTKQHFQQLLKVLMSHDPSEIILLCWFGAQETVLLNIFVETEIFLFLIVF